MGEGVAAMGVLGFLISLVFSLAVVVWMLVVAARLKDIRKAIESFHNDLAAYTRERG